jgi:hypothetical protein
MQCASWCAVIVAASLLSTQLPCKVLSAETNTPLRLPHVTIVTFPDSSRGAVRESPAQLAARAAKRRITGGETMPQGTPLTLLLQREALQQARVRRSSQIRLLHGVGQDAMPKTPNSP